MLDRELLLHLSLAAMLGLLLPGCPTGGTDDDDSAADDDDSAADDDDSVADDDDSVADDDDTATGSTAVVVTTDFTDTVLATVDVATGVATDDVLSIAFGDVGVQELGGDLYVIQRLGADLIQRYDGGVFGGAPDLEFSTGADSNPSSLAICDGRLYVSLAGASSVAAFDLTTGGPMGSVDLAYLAEADGDGGSEPAALYSDGSSLWVAVQRYNFNTYASDPVGKLVEIDCASNTVTAEHDVGPNPRFFADPGGALYLSEGDYFAADGGIRGFDLASGMLADELLVDESDLNADVTSVTLAGGIVVFSTWDFGANTFGLHCISPDGGDITDAATGMVSNIWSVQSAPDGSVWAFATQPWDNPDAPHGVITLDPASCSVTNDGSWISFGLPPSGAAFL